MEGSLAEKGEKTYFCVNGTSSLTGFTESQNHRITEWSGLEGTSVGHPVQPLLKQGHPEQDAQDRVPVGLEYLQRRRLHNLPGQPVPGLHHPQREKGCKLLQNTKAKTLQFPLLFLTTLT